MKNFKYFLGFIIISFISCQQQSNEATLIFEDIKQFPEEIILHQHTKNFVVQKDTFWLKNEKGARISVGIDRPKYVSVQKEGKFLHLFLVSGSTLKISKDRDRYVINGDLKGENTYLQDIQNDKELLEKSWDYSLPFDQFRHQVDDYFDFKRKLLDKNVSPDDNGYFYGLSTLDDRAFHNSILLDYIRTQSPPAEKDSLFLKYFDTDLLHEEYTKNHLESGYLRAFYSGKAVEYYMKKRYGEDLDSVRKQQEHYVLRDDIISEYFNQPLKSILIYNDLSYYPEEYDYLPDSMHLTPPQIMLDRYKDDLHDEAYADLVNSLHRYEAKKMAYAKGKAVPDFLMRNESNKEYHLKSTDFTKLTLIDTWASWCGPCIENFPKVRKLEKQYPDQLEVVSISIDRNYAEYNKGLQKHKLPGKINLYAKNGFASDFAKHFQIDAIPRYILIEPGGKIVDANLNLGDIDKVLNKEL